MLCAFGTFALHVEVLNKPLTVETAFAALALFNTLRKPLNMYPRVLNSVLDGWVAICRIERFLLSPEEMNDFVDPFGSEYVNVHFDTGNIMLFQFPEHWIPQLGKRIQNVHLKEFTKKGTDHSLECFRPLLDGTTDWPAVIEAFEKIGYDGYLTFEYFHPYPHYPEALIHQTADSLDRMLGIHS